MLLATLLLPLRGWAQGPILFTIANNSPFANTDLYVAVVGIDAATGNHILVNPRTNASLPISMSFNTVLGPTYNGAIGPGGN
ncbi:hypothetical protein [Hymenobacter sp. IS2118]|uniref:hypothetical protein n=1 Tax=Hymenobacter sp. IS2118 TaxID=1505605 RepID=UPI000A598829|nr:hypothetical protein [Hymenobacter sp. IS2118]